MYPALCFVAILGCLVSCQPHLLPDELGHGQQICILLSLSAKAVEVASVCAEEGLLKLCKLCRSPQRTVGDDSGSAQRHDHIDNIAWR
jgi:hypothetical protein